MAGFSDHKEFLEVQLENGKTVKAKYLIGADGPRSTVRQALGIRYGGETGITRPFAGGRMYAVYARMPEFYRAVPHRPAWMNVAFNPERRCFMPAVDGQGEFAFHTQLQGAEKEDSISEDQAIRMVQQCVGAPLKVEVIARAFWTAGHSLVAENFSSGRIFIGGDAAHLFTPMGGLGYNTAVEDAVNLGWKLASVLRGTASEKLLQSYEAERRPLALRNTAYAKGFADSLGNYVPSPEIEDDTAAGEAARKRAGEYYSAHGRAEFNIPGITFGGRYDGSPAIVPDGTAPPPDTPNVYVPTACPGGRPPHVWMPDGRSLYDLLGFEWTLLAFKPAAIAAQPNLKVLQIDHPEARDLYGADYALIRPDQIVAWRTNSPAGVKDIIGQICGVFPRTSAATG